MKTFYLIFLLCTFTLIETSAQGASQCPKVPDSSYCLGFLGTYYVSNNASQNNPSVLKIEIPHGVTVRYVSGPPGYYTTTMEGNILIMTWVRGLDGDEVWPEIAINEANSFYHIQVITVY